MNTSYLFAGTYRSQKKIPMSKMFSLTKFKSGKYYFSRYKLQLHFSKVLTAAKYVGRGLST